MDEKQHPGSITGPTGEKPSFRRTIQEILHIITHSETAVAINDGLAKVMSFFGSDRVYIGYFDESRSCLSFIHEISADGKMSLNDFLISQFQGSEVLYENDFPWWIGNVKKGIDTVIDDVHVLPREACYEQSLMIKNGLKSSLTTSIYSEGKIRGFIGMEFTRQFHIWTETEIENFHFFADLFSILIDNKKMHSESLAKEKLHESLEKLKMAINSANSYIWEYDVENDSINIDFSLLDYEHNQTAETEETVVQTSRQAHLERIHPDDIQRVLDQVHQIIAGEISSFTETYRQYLKKELHWYTTFFRTYKYDENNKPSKIICLTRDITKERENELALMNEKETNRVKTAFIENMSHELRTPLNAIVGFSNILADANETEENDYFIEIIRKNNDTLLQIIDSILSFTKIESGVIQYVLDDVDIKEICREAISLKSFNQKDSIQLCFDQNLPSLFTRTDRDRMVQVLFHLLDNAYKFTPEGSVTLKYSLCDEQKVRIEVIDTGIGLTQDEISKMFKQFYKADEFQVGLGLGLSISKKIIEDLGGTVGVDSKKGEGSTFWFHLPLASDV